MPTLEFEMMVRAPLAKVWQFYQHPGTNLPRLALPGEPVVIESADEPLGEGARVVLRLAGPLGRPIRWVARIVEHRPPHPVVFGEEARFVDEQEQGPLAYWRHEHDLEAMDSKSTRIVDRITYRLPLAPLGWILDVLYFRRRLRRMFAARQQALRQALE
jgi:ligand-binding SRPBCC domain-containing protein